MGGKQIRSPSAPQEAVEWEVRGVREAWVMLSTKHMETTYEAVRPRSPLKHWPRETASRYRHWGKPVKSDSEHLVSQVKAHVQSLLGHSLRAEQEWAESLRLSSGGGLGHPRVRAPHRTNQPHLHPYATPRLKNTMRGGDREREKEEANGDNAERPTPPMQDVTSVAKKLTPFFKIMGTNKRLWEIKGVAAELKRSLGESENKFRKPREVEEKNKVLDNWKETVCSVQSMNPGCEHRLGSSGKTELRKQSGGRHLKNTKQMKLIAGRSGSMGSCTREVGMMH